MTRPSPPAVSGADSATITRRPPSRSRPARPPLAPSPVALALASVFRHGGRVASRLVGRPFALPLAAIVAIAIVGLWLPGPGTPMPTGDAGVARDTDAARRSDGMAATDTVVTDAVLANATGTGGSTTAFAADGPTRVAVALPTTGSIPPMPAPSSVPAVDESPPEPSVPARLHERVVAENRALEARVAALEAETTALESEMLALDLQLVVLDSAARAADVDLDAIGGETAASGVAPAGPPLELGNATLVPPPLSELGERGDVPADVREREPPPQSTAETFAAREPFLPEAAFDEELPPPFQEIPSEVPDDRGGGGRAAASAAVGLPVERVVVAEVPDGSGADDAGLLPGDILVAIDGRPVSGFEDLDPYAASGDPTPLHELEIVRGGQRQWLDLASSPAELTLVTRWIDPARLALD